MTAPVCGSGLVGNGFEVLFMHVIAKNRVMFAGAFQEDQRTLMILTSSPSNMYAFSAMVLVWDCTV